MANWLKRLWPQKLVPLVLYKRTEQIVWTRGDAAAWKSILASPVWAKIEAFTQDAIMNGFLAGGDKAFLTGWLHGMAHLATFKGEDDAQEPKENPRDSVPIQISGE